MKNEVKETAEIQASGAVLTRKELLELHRLVIEDVRKLTTEQGFKDLIASGIYTPEGKLAKEYGG